MAESGASISTINAKLKWPDNALSNILARGKSESKGPYRRFYLSFRGWAADAKWAAEANLAKKSPEKFLDRSSTARMIEDSDDASLRIESNNANTKGALPPGVEAAKVLQSLKILQQQGISIDETLEKGQIDLINLEDHTDEDDKTD